MPRVFLVAPDARGREDLRRRLDPAVVTVAGEGERLHDAHRRDVDVIVAEHSALTTAERDGGEDDLPAIVVVGERRRQLSFTGTRGSGVVPASATRAELTAAVAAAALGFDVRPAARRHRPDDDPGPGAADEPESEALTAREHDVLESLAQGLGNREIAAALGISEHTVKFHLAAIFGKLGVTTRTAAVRQAVRRGLLAL